MNIEPNMTRAEVLDTLGDPGARSFRDNFEALQYCSTGWNTDEYVTVWLEDGVVKGLTRQNDVLAAGFCSQSFPPVDWCQAPADMKIPVEDCIAARNAAADSAARAAARAEASRRAWEGMQEGADRISGRNRNESLGGGDSRVSGVCVRERDWGSGFNRICVYRCGLSEVVNTIPSSQFCPMRPD